MLRKTLGSFSIKRLSFDSVVDVHVSGSIIICILNRNNYHNLQPQENGFMSRHDAKNKHFLHKKLNILSLQTFGLMVSGFILIEPIGQ